MIETDHETFYRPVEHQHDWRPYREWQTGRVREAWDQCECGSWRRTQIGSPEDILNVPPKERL